MSKFVVFFALMVITLTSYAQSDSEHLNFRGVPIDGTLGEFVSKMESAGFKYLAEQDGIAILQGDFAGFKGCTIVVATLKSTNIVNTIGVMFSEQNDWASLENSYGHLKSMLTEKYGEPLKCVEKFQGYDPQTDSQKLNKLKFDECTWYTTYSTPKGDIQLSIDNQSVMSCFVALRYFDRINTEAVRTQAMEDL